MKLVSLPLVAVLGAAAAGAAVPEYGVVHRHPIGAGMPMSSFVDDGAGSLYGTTYRGGDADSGSAYRYVKATNVRTVLHSFRGGAADGSGPAGVVRDGAGNLYGTTWKGGAADGGVVYTMKADGTGFAILHAFAGAADGLNPRAGVAVDGAGNLYGTTSEGGASGFGTIFTLRTDGTGFSVLHHFAGAADGGAPAADLALDGAGNLFGTASEGGASGLGTVFRVKTDGTGFTVLRALAAADGAHPYGPVLLDGSGNLFGTASASGGAAGAGVLFRMKTDGTLYTRVHTFAGADGFSPQGALALSGGYVYGATRLGGAMNEGTAYRVLTDGTGFTSLRSFTGIYGRFPVAGVFLDGSGKVWGTTTQGGQGDVGVVFFMQLDGTLYTRGAFAEGPVEGATPKSGLVSDGAGHLFGTTYRGDSHDGGTVFRMDLGGANFTVLHRFRDANSEGVMPGRLVCDGAGNLYGTTTVGVFRIGTDGTGFTMLHTFAFFGPEGSGPGNLVRDAAGTLYGTCTSGGASNAGTLFRIQPDGSGFSVLRSFGATASDGSQPVGALALDGAGKLYGMTQGGGAYNYGTLYVIGTDGSGYTPLHSFGATGDKSNPAGGPLLDGLGYVYGAMPLYGAYAAGYLFRMRTDGTGYTVIHDFIYTTDGNKPQPGLVWDAAGRICGTTEKGGTNNYGVLWAVNPDGTGFTALHLFAGGTDGSHPNGELILVNGIVYGTSTGDDANGLSSIVGTEFGYGYLTPVELTRFAAE